MAAKRPRKPPRQAESGDLDVSLGRLASLSLTEAALLLGISEEVLLKAKVPRNPDGSINGPFVVAWWFQASEEDLKARKLRTDIELNAEKIVQKSLENRERQKEVVDVIEMRKKTAAMALAFRNLGDRLASRESITGREAQRMLNETLLILAKEEEAAFK